MIQVPSQDLILFAAQHRNKLLMYPFQFSCFQGTALFDTGADRSLVSKQFAYSVELPSVPLSIKQVIIADGRIIKVTKEVKPFRAHIGDLQTTLLGLIVDIPKYNVVLGLDWMQKTKPFIDWESATLTIQRGAVHHQIYPNNLDTLMREHLFVKISQTQDKLDLNKIDWEQCTYEIVHFKNIASSDKTDPYQQQFINEFKEVFLEKLPGLPPDCGIQQKIDLKGSIPKARHIYRLTPQENDALKEYLREALDKGLVRPLKSPFGAAVFF